MADAEHLKILSQGWEAWNEWRADNYFVTPDLSNADLRDFEFGDRSEMMTRLLANRHRFQGVDFSESDLSGVKLNNANLLGADLGRANLNNADLRKANLNYANMERADASGANLSGARLHHVNLTGANLTGAILSDAELEDADLSRAILSNAKLNGSDLTRVRLVETYLNEADITDCMVYGLSAWGVQISNTIQSNLIVTPKGEPVITVDNLEVAQFIYLLLNNQKIRDVINTLGQKAVLILGRFSPERKEILDAIAGLLRRKGFLPIIFDFEKSEERNFKETIMTLAGLSLFVVADITNPKSSPLELQATIPNFMIPFVPIIQDHEEPFSMFVDLQNTYDWVLETFVYDTKSNLLEALDTVMIQSALDMHDRLVARRARRLKSVHIKDILKTQN